MIQFAHFNFSEKSISPLLAQGEILNSGMFQGLSKLLLVVISIFLPLILILAKIGDNPFLLVLSVFKINWTLNVLGCITYKFLSLIIPQLPIEMKSKKWVTQFSKWVFKPVTHENGF